MSKYRKWFCMNKFFFLASLFVLMGSKLLFSQPRQGMGGGGYNPDAPKIGVIKGKIVDKSTSTPLEYANVVLYKVRDSSMVEGAITDVDGAFRMEKLPFGRYFARVQYIGYPLKTIDSIMIRPDKPEFTIGTVSLSMSSKTLEAVEITDKKAALEFNLDKKIVNVDQTLASSGGTAVDIMQTIPAVQVDIEGNVSLRGSSNLLMLVDGRPSGLVSLDQLPASMVERVEIITNPSAKYDPDGATGIINIVLKKKKTPGYNGMVSLNAGTSDRYNASVNLNYRYHKFNVFGTYDYRKFTHKSTNSLDRLSWTPLDTFNLMQYSKSRRSGEFHNIRFGMDYFLNDINTLSASGVRNFRNYSGFEDMSNISGLFEGDTTGMFVRNTNDSNKDGGMEYTLNYKRKLDERNGEITADLFYSNMEGDRFSLMNTLFPDTSLSQGYDFSDEKNLSGMKRKAFTAQSDFVKAYNFGRVELGYKYSNGINDMDYEFLVWDDINWQTDTNRTNHFVYSEQLHSAYAIYSNTIGSKFRYQFGLRAEQAYTVSDQRTLDSVYKNQYFSVYPSTHLRYELSAMHMFQISYSRRVNRPGAWVLNPFINYSDPLNLSSGNPYLNPEYVNSGELGYTFTWKNTSVNTNLFYRHTTDVITRIMKVNENGQSFTTFTNQDRANAYGFEFILTQQILKWWKANGNFSYFKSEYVGTDISSKTSTGKSWNFKFNSQMTLPYDMELQVNFYYNAPSIMAPGIGGGFRGGMMGGGVQGKMAENYSADIGFRKKVLKGNGTVSVRVSDVFDTQRNESTSYGNNFESTSYRKRDSRVLFVGLSYRFNDYKRRQIKSMENGMMEEGE